MLKARQRSPVSDAEQVVNIISLRVYTLMDVSFVASPVVAKPT